MKTELTDEQVEQVIDLCRAGLAGRLDRKWADGKWVPEFPEDVNLTLLTEIVTGDVGVSEYRIAPRRLSFREAVEAEPARWQWRGNPSYKLQVRDRMQGRFDDLVASITFLGGPVGEIPVALYRDAEWEEVTE